MVIYPLAKIRANHCVNPMNSNYIGRLLSVDAGVFFVAFFSFPRFPSHMYYYTTLYLSVMQIRQTVVSIAHNKTILSQWHDQCAFDGDNYVVTCLSDLFYIR